MNLEKLGPWATAVYAIVDRYGTKFAVAVAVIAAIGYGTYDQIIEPWIGTAGMVVVAVGYFFADFKHKKGTTDAQVKIINKTPTA